MSTRQLTLEERISAFQNGRERHANPRGLHRGARRERRQCGVREHCQRLSVRGYALIMIHARSGWLMRNPRAVGEGCTTFAETQ